MYAKSILAETEKYCDKMTEMPPTPPILISYGNIKKCRPIAYKRLPNMIHMNIYRGHIFDKKRRI